MKIITKLVTALLFGCGLFSVSGHAGYFQCYTDGSVSSYGYWGGISVPSACTITTTTIYVANTAVWRNGNWVTTVGEDSYEQLTNQPAGSYDVQQVAGPSSYATTEFSW